MGANGAFDDYFSKTGTWSPAFLGNLQEVERNLNLFPLQRNVLCLYIQVEAGPSWVQYSSTFSSMTWTAGLNAPSKSLLVTLSSMAQLIQQKEGIPS